MQALMAYSTIPAGEYSALHVRHRVRALSYQPWRAVMPVLLAILRLCMGVVIGGLFGLVAGNLVFWIAAGTALGSLVGHVADAAPARPPTQGVYPLRR